ncbi:MAG: class I SAM-dependent methyltransferase [Desulfotignum sp.]|nr:class I SAM-dependent methyltransferase [Desulfotignum sp.]MCF8090616.1 class I SAM-dependent methyltransferase [Desulfotignum sp.]
MAQNSDLQKETLDYYQSNAKQFFNDTVSIDLSDLYRPFLERLPETGLILDAGCGSGRDTRFFTRQGFEVVAFDNAPEMVKLASHYTGQDCLLLSFDDIHFENKFDGVWACSSMLHVPKSNMINVLNKLCTALRHDGILYTSFKYGDDEVFRNGRLFSNYDEESFHAVITDQKELDMLKYWKTNDLRPGREGEQWLNILLQKKR